MEYRILIVGSGAREHAIARSIIKTQIDHKLFCIASNKNPGIINICDELILGDIENADFIVENVGAIEHALHGAHLRRVP